MPTHIAKPREVVAFLNAGESASEHLADNEEADFQSEIQNLAE